MGAPDIFRYTDFRAYLADWFQHRKKEFPGFSHRNFARRIGSKDPSVLANVIAGRRRLSDRRADQLARQIGLREDAADYFGLLVRFGQADAREERDRAFASLVKFRLLRSAPAIDRDRFQYLSRWMYAAVCELAKCHDFRPDPVWVARRLRPRVDPAEAADALELLERLGFLRRERDTLVPAGAMLHSSELVEQLGSYGYHRDCNRIAGDVIEHLLERRVADETAFLGFTLAVSNDRLAQVRDLLWQAHLQVAHQCEQWPGPRDRVVQVSVQMFPVSASDTAHEE